MNLVTYSEIWLGTVNSGAITSITIALSGSTSSGAIADVCEYSGIQHRLTSTNSGSRRVLAQVPARDNCRDFTSLTIVDRR